MFPNLRRTAAVAASVTVAALIAVSPASAADSTVLWRPGDTPAGVGFWSNDCAVTEDAPLARTSLTADDADLESTASLVAGSSAGDVAWALHPSASSQGGPAVAVGPDVQSVSIRVKGESDGRLFVYYADGDTQYYATAPVVEQSTTGWHDVDLSGNLSWYSPALLGGWSPKRFVWDWSPTYSLPRFIKDAQIDHGTFLVGYELGCSAGPVAIDHLRVTTTSGTTDYDLTNRTSTTSLTLDRTSVTGSGTVALTSGVTDSAGNAVIDGTVAVMARPDGASSFAQVGPSIGPGESVQVSPTTRTTYRLDYSGGIAAGPSSSSSATVTVRPKITMTANRTASRLGKMVTLKGTTTPARAGVAVTLQRKLGSRWRKVARVLTDDSGAYVAKIRPNAGGAWRLRAQLAASAGNASATSSSRKVTVQIPTRISARVRPGKVLLGKRYAVVGRAKQARKGTRVRLQIKVGKQWATIGRTRLSRTLTYRFHPKSTLVGRFVLRTVLSRSGAHLGSRSERVRLRVTVPPTITPPAPTPTPTPTPSHPVSQPPGGVGHG